MQKGISGIGIIFIIVAFLSGVFLYHKYSKTIPNSSTTQSSNSNATEAISTGNWETYTNEKYGYFLKYPADASLEILTAGEGQNDGLIIKLPTTGKIYIHHNQSYHKNPQEFSEYLDGIIPQPGLSMPNFKIEDRRTINIGGVEGERVVTNDDFRGRLINAYLLNKGTDYYFTLKLDYKGAAEDIKTFDAILENMEFTNKKQVDISD